MPSVLGAALLKSRRFGWLVNAGFCGIAAILEPVAAPQAAERPPAAMLLDRLCSETMRANEEDRLYGLISLTVRTQIKYQSGVFSPDFIDDAVQDGLGAMIEACPKIAATPDNQRLGMVVQLISDATTARMQDPKSHYSDAETEKATAADLSEELSLQEIDAWLDALPARQRALALFLYSSNVRPDEIATAVGLPAGGLDGQMTGVKTDLLRFYRADWSVTPPPPIPAPASGAAAIEYHVAGQDLGALLKPPANVEAKPEARTEASARVTGISSNIFAGWSLLASVTGLPADRSLDVNTPVFLEPALPDHRRMIAVAVEEITDPHAEVRRFLLKAYAIDGDKEGSGLNDTFHIAATPPPLNPVVTQTLKNRMLAGVEIARCLWRDFDTADDPGYCP
jgi:hypothetical protein